MESHTRKQSSPQRPGAGKGDTDLTRPPRDDEHALQFERDESREPPDADDARLQGIEQAARDIKRGLLNTDRRGLPSDLPGPGAKPEDTHGAAVPQSGINSLHPGRGSGEENWGRFRMSSHSGPANDDARPRATAGCWRGWSVRERALWA